MTGRVFAVSRASGNVFSKPVQDRITLIEGLGVEGDAHSGVTVQHLYLKKKDPTVPNLRQVHLVQAELFDDLKQKGFEIGPGEIGENIATTGIDLPALPEGTRLQIGGAVIEVTGIRNPCGQLDSFQKGLTKAVTAKNADRKAYLRSAVMGIVVRGGGVKAGDAISIELPAEPHCALQPV
jgi:MOSC domain-containing protein YiiM